MTPEFVARAEEALARADTFMADAAARTAAELLMTDRLREGHILAIEAHVRALIVGLGVDEAIGVLAAMAREIETIGDDENDDAAWDQLPVGKRPQRRTRNERERLEGVLADAPARD